MRMTRLGQRTKKLAALPSSSEDDSLKTQQRAELLRSRIEELNRRLAILNSASEEFGHFEEPLDGGRRTDDSGSSNSPMLLQRLRR
jgi:hypothetical protein